MKKPPMKEKAIIPAEVASSGNADVSTALAPTTSGLYDRSPTRNDASASPIPTSSEKKRPQPNDNPSLTASDKKNKKQKRSSAFVLSTGDRNTTATEIASGAAGSEFPDGWVIKTYRRSGGETIGKTDRFWFSPGRNIRFRAKKHALAFVDILNEAHVGGDEDKAAELYRIRGLHF